MRFYSYLNTAARILLNYRGEQPFASVVKNFFKAEKKYGSRDRKTITHLCYCCFRLGKSLQHIPIEEQIMAGLFLCSTEPNEMLAELRPEWNKAVHFPIGKKCSMLSDQCSIPDVFPWKEALSQDIDHKKFCESFFIQPDLFLRLRPGKETGVRSKLAEAGIFFREITGSCLSLSNATKIENIVELDKDAVVQDLNSQKTVDALKSEIIDLKPAIRIWDCCAGSGGKSILLHDLLPHIDLTVSDARESIIQNLKKRFASAAIPNYHALVADLSSAHASFTIQYAPFNLIICDAPCTGSGTWSRTPEQLYFFDEGKITQYAALQKKIISNVIPHLVRGGYFLYITCSVFKKENEENVDFITSQCGLELAKSQLLKGYDKKADTLFVAVFRKTIA